MVRINAIIEIIFVIPSVKNYHDGGSKDGIQLEAR